MNSIEFLFYSSLFNGILGNSFGRLFSVIWDAISWVGQQIGSFFMWLGGLIWDAVTWVGELLFSLFTELFQLLMVFFEFIYALVDALLYFLWQIGLVVAKVFIIFFELLMLIWSFAVGFGRTLASLTYSPSSGSGHAFSEMLGNIFTALQPLQLNVVAVILMFGVWIFTAMQVIRILSGLRVGGE
ncbi:hypothetical protein [Halalkalibacter hemicellulosilyticus]|uniref:Uncharacterized protein n=1 Tax=Halalkalibacter hemicellulosilyticusJCM 9152 TaxID=1236971 RepID=W4QL75_9BACI|nr:hypothetical protein [Halalkalibacter hemicellulosilyticus]GAE32870.1 hypothetical protein JCM9152_4461 [Halalkalibacter hemicellulosilyticusJCM 9152]